ncbi:hypothetical protein PM082_024493 [Marasmius tenuissimus]|nr:hypothetical protein PM082_024493 [Marasmius tenuissimus]
MDECRSLATCHVRLPKRYLTIFNGGCANQIGSDYTGEGGIEAYSVLLRPEKDQTQTLILVVPSMILRTTYQWIVYSIDHRDMNDFENNSQEYPFDIVLIDQSHQLNEGMVSRDEKSMPNGWVVSALLPTFKLQRIKAHRKMVVSRILSRCDECTVHTSGREARVLPVFLCDSA